MNYNKDKSNIQNRFGAWHPNDSEYCDDGEVKVMDLRRDLRSLKSLEGPFPTFDVRNVPESPHELFEKWMRLAIQEVVHEPHAMTLSTIGLDGFPDARVLILKNVNKNGWYFASSSESKKGRQIEINPAVTLTFYWSKIGRQVRITGTASNTGDEASFKDFSERGKTARAITLIGKQSRILPDLEQLEVSFNEQLERLENELDYPNPNWILYCVTAKRVEFWQGDPERKHTRLQYHWIDNEWKKELLWP